MFFNSIVFLIFFVIVYAFYLVLKHKPQNILLLVASYFFYGWWDWRFLILLFISTVVDFVTAQKIFISPTEKLKKRWLLLTICFNLTLLGFFKYFNFFITSFNTALSFFHLDMNPVL